MWFVYVLTSEKSRKLYVGMTQNIDRRLAEHNDGKSKFTSGFVPWTLIYSEHFASAGEARTREKYFKSAAGKRFLHAKNIRAGSLPD